MDLLASSTLAPLCRMEYALACGPRFLEEYVVKMPGCPLNMLHY